MTHMIFFSFSKETFKFTLLNTVKEDKTLYFLFTNKTHTKCHNFPNAEVSFTPHHGTGFLKLFPDGQDVISMKNRRSETMGELRLPFFI